MSFSRENDPSVAGYVIELATQISENHKKEWERGKNDDVKYLVVLPRAMTEKELAIEITDQLEKKSIEKYIDQERLYEVEYYPGDSARVQVLLKDLPRQWYYGRVAPLALEKEAGGGILSLKTLFG